MEIIGHRGCADQYPENTVTAVTEAARRLDAVEVDVRRCGSGELVVFHDERVDALTDGTGRIADLDWAELRTLDVRGSEESIPRLATVIDAVPVDVTLQIELKERGLATDVRTAVAAAEREPETENTASATDDIAADGGVDTEGTDAGGSVNADSTDQNVGLDVVVTSFEADALAAIDALDWDVPTGYLFHDDPASNLRTAVELNCDAVHPHYDSCLATDVVAGAHERNLDVVAWKAVTTAAEVDALRVAGVDGVTADRWDVA